MLLCWRWERGERRRARRKREQREWAREGELAREGKYKEIGRRSREKGGQRKRRKVKATAARSASQSDAALAKRAALVVTMQPRGTLATKIPAISRLNAVRSYSGQDGAEGATEREGGRRARVWAREELRRKERVGEEGGRAAEREDHGEEGRRFPPQRFQRLDTGSAELSPSALPARDSRDRIPATALERNPMLLWPKGRRSSSPCNRVGLSLPEFPQSLA
jgi:hypothetical protein